MSTDNQTQNEKVPDIVDTNGQPNAVVSNNTIVTQNDANTNIKSGPPQLDSISPELANVETNTGFGLIHTEATQSKSSDFRNADDKVDLASPNNDSHDILISENNEANTSKVKNEQLALDSDAQPVSSVNAASIAAAILPEQHQHEHSSEENNKHDLENASEPDQKPAKYEASSTLESPASTKECIDGIQGSVDSSSANKLQLDDNLASIVENNNQQELSQAEMITSVISDREGSMPKSNDSNVQEPTDSRELAKDDSVLVDENSIIQIENQNNIIDANKNGDRNGNVDQLHTDSSESEKPIIGNSEKSETTGPLAATITNSANSNKKHILGKSEDYENEGKLEDSCTADKEVSISEKNSENKKDLTLPEDNDIEEQNLGAPLDLNKHKDSDTFLEETNEEHSQSKESDIQEIPQLHKIVLPSYASWFSLNKINDIEVRGIPEFFNNANSSKTPLIYVYYRNFMINAYRLNPNEYLSLTAIRRNLAGDAGCLLRIHRFLTKWGIINYQVNPENKVMPVAPPSIPNASIRYDNPRGLFPFESFTIPEKYEKEKIDKLKNMLQNGASNADSETKTEPKKEENDKETKIRNNIESSKSGDEEFPSKRSRIISDFNSGWSRLELKKLLIAVQENSVSGDHGTKFDWLRIASFVGTKSPDQCIARFLQLPIEDPFLDKMKNLGPLKYAPHLPYSSADNPIISTITYLSSLVDKDIVIAAKNRAIKKVDEIYLNKLKDSIKTGKDEDITMTELESTIPLETKHEKNDENFSESLKENLSASLAGIAGRAHLFATYEERQLNYLVSTIINQSINKVELKLEKLTAAEMEIEQQKKTLINMQNDIITSKLSMGKRQKHIYDSFSKLNTRMHKSLEILKKNVFKADSINFGGIESQSTQQLALPIVSLSDSAENDANEMKAELTVATLANGQASSEDNVHNASLLKAAISAIPVSSAISISGGLKSVPINGNNGTDSSHNVSLLQFEIRQMEEAMKELNKDLSSLTDMRLFSKCINRDSEDDSDNDEEEELNPLSVEIPKSYQFWSA